MKKKLIIGLAVGSLALASVAAAQVLRGGYDEPAYRVAMKDGMFEVRKYQERIVAETVVDREDWRRATSTGFERLAGYIFGGNTSKDGGSEKIAMTTPVETGPTNDDEMVVVFTMPPGYGRDDLPTPNDDRVEIRTVPPATVATLRFSGKARRKNIDALRSELLEKVEANGYRATEEIRVAQYDPPWTPSFLRRNELMVTVEKTE